MGRTVTFRSGNLHSALTPCNRTGEIVHVRRRLQTDDIVFVSLRHYAGRSSNRIDRDRIRNPKGIETIEITCHIRHGGIVEGQHIISGDRIQRNSIIRKDPAAFVLVMSSSTSIVRDEKSIVTVTVIVTGFTDIPLVRQVIIGTLVSSRIEFPTATSNRVLEITGVPSNSLNRSSKNEGCYHEELYESIHYIYHFIIYHLVIY